MRVTLTDSGLARYARRFVWLELNFDSPENRAFLTRHGAPGTPAFYVLDPFDEHALATQIGAMTLSELTGFLDRGEHAFLAKGKTPAEAALAKGDALLAVDRQADAAAAYTEAIRLGGDAWPERDRAAASRAWALMSSNQWRACAETAAADAPEMTRAAIFGRIVLAGMWCVNQGASAPWAQAAAGTLEPLAAEAISLPSTVRDHRFQLYQNLMLLAEARGDAAAVKVWGDRWLHELDTTQPGSNDERAALDIARVDAASLLGDSSRVLPALIESERAMPDDYNSSLRLAQMEIEAGHLDAAVAACDRGLAHVTGALGRAWLLETKAEALMRKGKGPEAHRVLEEALESAKAIPVARARDHNIQKISAAMKEAQKTGK
jgi:tetratricopeptide (TPR) repeat protein